MKHVLYASLVFGLACAAPLSASTFVRARASIPHDDLERGSFYYNNNSVEWRNGTVTVSPGILNPRQSVSVTSPLASAHAYADLETGRLGAYAFGVGTNYAGANAWFDEDLKFAIAGATSKTITPIRVIAALHAVTPAFYSAGFSVGFTGQDGAAYTSGGAQYLMNNSLNGVYYTNVGGNRLASFSSWIVDDLRYFDLTYNAVGASPVLGFSMNLAVSGGLGVATDMSHTASVKFVLPSNVTFTSTSGVFLARAVPEPAAWVMMMAGFGFIGAALRRNRTATCWA